MALLTPDYFIGGLSLGLGTNGESTLTTVWISRLENPFLYKVLGYGFARQFIDGYAEDTPAQKWVDLAEGKEYTVNDTLYKWVGFANEDELLSPIANYIYCMYMIDNASQTTIIGEQQAQIQNAANANASNKIHKSWCDMLEMLGSLYHFLDNNTDTYEDYDSTLVINLGSLNGFNF